MSTAAIAHCRNLLKQYDYPEYVSSLFLSASLMPLKWALGALNIETARAKVSGSKQEFGLARLQYFKEALSSMNDLFKNAYFKSSEIEEYSEATYSNILYIMLEFAGVKSFQVDHVASHVGKAIGITAFIKSAFLHTKSGFDAGIPVDMLAKRGLRQVSSTANEKVWANEAMKATIHEMADTAWSHLLYANSYTKSLSVPHLNRMLLSARVTQRYLEHLQSVDFDLSRRELHRFDRWLPIWLAWQLVSCPGEVVRIQQLDKNNHINV